MTALDLDVRLEDDIIHAHVGGVVDSSTVDEFVALLERLLTAAFPTTALYLTTLTHLSSGGALAVARQHEEILVAGRELRVVCGAGGPRAALDAVEVDHRPTTP